MPSLVTKVRHRLVLKVTARSLTVSLIFISVLLPYQNFALWLTLWTELNLPAYLAEWPRMSALMITSLGHIVSSTLTRWIYYGLFTLILLLIWTWPSCSPGDALSPDSMSRLSCGESAFTTLVLSAWKCSTPLLSIYHLSSHICLILPSRWNMMLEI